MVCSLTRDVFKDLLYNIQTKAKVVGHSDVPTDSGSWNEARMVFEAMEYIMDQTARVSSRTYQSTSHNFFHRTF